MSRGPGRIERAILTAMQAEPENAFSVEDLCERVYPGVNRVEKKHRVAVLRAMRRLRERQDNLAIMRGEGVGGTLVIYAWDKVMSYAMARLKCWHYRGNDMRLPAHWRASEADLRERLTPGGRDHRFVEEGGAWWRHVQIWIAERDGDKEKAAELQADLDAELAILAAAIGR